jgi:hypothetical protein
LSSPDVGDGGFGIIVVEVEERSPTSIVVVIIVQRSKVEL